MCDLDVVEETAGKEFAVFLFSQLFDLCLRQITGICQGCDVVDLFCGCF